MVADEQVSRIELLSSPYLKNRAGAVSMILLIPKLTREVAAGLLANMRRGVQCRR